MKMSEKKTKSGDGFMFEKANYVLMIVGMLVMVVGYLLMIGGKSPDPNVFNADELYSFRRISLSPIVIMIGLGIEVFAIFYKGKNEG